MHGLLQHPEPIVIQWPHAAMEKTGGGPRREGVNTDDLRLFARVVLGWLLGTWISGGVSPFPEPTSMVPCAKTLCANYMVCTEYCLPSGCPEFWYMLGKGCRHN